MIIANNIFNQSLTKICANAPVMAGIGPAIITGITGTNKPGDASGSKNKVAALSISNITDKKKAIENGQNPDATAEVAKNDKQNTGITTTTTKDSAEKTAKDAVKTPRERLVGHIEEMNKTLQKFQEENNGKIAEAQAFGQQAQQNKAAEDMVKMLAAQQQPKAETPKAPAPSQSKPSSNNNSNEAVKKLAEQQKEVNAKQQEQMQKLAEALKQEKAKNKESDSPEAKLEKAQKALEARKAREAETDNTRRSGAADKALEASGDKKTQQTPFTDEQKIVLSKLIGEVRDLNPAEQKAVLASLNRYSEADSSTKPIEEKAKGIVDSKASSSVDEATTNDIQSRSDCEDYGDNYFSLDFQSRSDDVNQDLERDTDKSLNEVAKDSTEVIEENQKQVDEIQEEQEEDQTQAAVDALLADIGTPDTDIEE